MRLSLLAVPILLTPGTFAQQQQSKSATLIFYREGHFGGSARKPSVYIDGVEASRLKNGSYFSIPVEPGKHNLTSVTKREPPLVIDLKPGETGYVQMILIPSDLSGDWRLVSVPVDMGKYAVSKLKSSDLTK
jgi:hypothetical protein